MGRGGERDMLVIEVLCRPDTESSEEEEEARPMTVRFARHAAKSEADSAPSPSEEEWIHLRPVAFEVGSLCYSLLGWTEAATHCWVLYRTVRQTL